MRLRLLAGLATWVSVALTVHGQPNCPTLWLDLGGKGQDSCLTIPDAWPLDRFGKQIPSWDPDLLGEGGRYVGPAPRDALHWDALETPVPVSRVGTVGGSAVYDIAYSESYHVLVWDVGAGRFRPTLIVSGDESIVARVYPAEPFRWHGSDIVHIRIQISGTGNLQESVFLASLGATVVPLRPAYQPMLDWLSSKQLRLFHRGGGFCEGSFVFQAGVEDRAGGRAGGVVAEYAIVGSTLVPESMRVYLQDDRGPDTKCELYPTMRGHPTTQ